MSARDVIVNSLFEPGPDKLDGFSQDDRQVALKRADAIISALDAAGFKIIHRDELMEFLKAMEAAKETT